MSHRFKLHQRVRITPQGVRESTVAQGDVWEVVRLMPPDERGEPSYRIRCNGVERAAAEQTLEAA